MVKVFVLSFLWLFLLSLNHSAIAEFPSCLICHGAMKGKIQKERDVLVDLHVDGEKYLASVHGMFNCTVCHKSFSVNPHQPARPGDVPSNVAALAEKLSHRARIDPVAHAACIQCHGDMYKGWQNSVHGSNIIDKKKLDGPLCTDCHGSPHYITPKNTINSPVNRKNVVKTCAKCHDRKDIAEKYNYHSYIVERYYKSFHGKKHLLGHPNAPTCVNCHGYHNVRKWDDPLSPVAWENRIVTCGKCHEGATQKFVSSVTHKPIDKDNPIPYYVRIGLIVLMLSVFVFVVGHVFLEAYAEIRDRVLKKKKEGHHE